MNVRQGLQGERDGAHLFLAEVLLHERVELGLQRRRIGPVRQLHVRVEHVAAPAEELRLFFLDRGHRRHDIELEVRRLGHVGHDGSDRVRTRHAAPLHLDGLPHRIGRAEVPLRRRRGEDGGVRSRQRLSGRCATLHGKREHLQKAGIGRDHRLIAERIAALRHRYRLPHEPHHALHRRKRGFHGGPEGRRRHGQLLHRSKPARLRDAVDVVGVGVEAVVAPFVNHVPPDEEAGSQPGGQPQDVDERVPPPLPKRAQGNRQMTRPHSGVLNR